MILNEVQPADVYALVDERTAQTQYLVFWCLALVAVLCVLVVCQIVAKLFIFRMVIKLLNEVVTLMKAVTLHGKFTDAARADTQEAAKQAREAVERLGAVAGLPAEVHEATEVLKGVDENVKAVKEHVEGASGTYAGPHNRRADDNKG